MRLAIVGSVSLAGNAEAAKVIEDVLTRYDTGRWQGLVVVSGGAEGIDSMAIEAAKRRGLDYKEHFPEVQQWADKDGKRGFKSRNILIARDCNRLIRIVASNSKTYGSGFTRDFAKKLGTPTEEYVIEVEP